MQVIGNHFWIKTLSCLRIWGLRGFPSVVNKSVSVNKQLQWMDKEFSVCNKLMGFPK